MNWFWLNIPPAAAIFAAMVGIPLWVVSSVQTPGRTRHLRWPPARAVAAQASQPEQARPQFLGPAPHARGGWCVSQLWLM
jgi:hypothetical protein